jgi:hypothetical protein
LTNFLLGFHCHQPVGNFESVLKEVHDKSYSPLIRTLLKYDSCKFCLHISGYLLEWIVKNDYELIKLIREGVAWNKVEMLGGGYYEPILASIPLSDRIKQLEMLNKAIKKYFGVYPKGAWVTERIWQPDIIESLNEAGLDYVFLDDFQFFQSGVDANNIDKIFLTEYNGKYINLFPIHERLRYKIPFAEPNESVSEVLHIKGRVSRLSVMIDDGEKMGSWPDTYEWVYGRVFKNSGQNYEDGAGNENIGKNSNNNGNSNNNIDDNSNSNINSNSNVNSNNGWLDKFLVNINSPASNIKMKLPSELISENFSRQLAYLPMSSYREMGEWTLPIEKRFKYVYTKEKYPDAALAGGLWHNFFIHYPESNLLHKRMLYLSGKVNTLFTEFPEIGNLSDYKKLKIELFKSQANDAYWHGVFGGIYLPHLRKAIQNSLIKASVHYDLIADELIQSRCNARNNNTDKNYNNVKTEIDIYDFDADGELEYQLRNKFWQAVYKPSVSQIIALDYIVKGMVNPFGDIFCLHDEYDLHIIKDKLNIRNELDENKKIDENEANVPHTIHDNTKIPEGLTGKDFITRNGLMPHFQLLYNGSDLNFNLKSIKNKNGIFVIKSEGYMREDKDENEKEKEEKCEERNCGRNGIEKQIYKDNVFQEKRKNKILLNLEITVSDAVRYRITINNDNKDNKYLLKDLSLFFRFSFAGGDGPATYIKPDGKNVYGLRENLINIPVDSPIELGDSYWGGNLKAFVSTNGYANYKANEDDNINKKNINKVHVNEGNLSDDNNVNAGDVDEDNDINADDVITDIVDKVRVNAGNVNVGDTYYTPLLNCSPITTVSIYEGGYEKIFQASELNIFWNIEKSVISDINIEWKVEKNKAKIAT